MAWCRIAFDRVSDGRIERTTPQTHRQFDAEDLQKPADFIFKVDAFPLHARKNAEQRQTANVTSLI